MKYLTMVARNGDPKAKANMMHYTLIGDDFSIHTMSGDKLAAAINDGKAVVTNLAVSAKGLVSTNGAMDKYTTINPMGNVVGTPRHVILNRMEVNGKLSGYVVFTANGVIAQMKVAEAAALASQGLIANGKIRHTAEGDIVAAIGGNYPLIETKIEAPKADKPTVDVVFFSSALKDGKTLCYGGVTVTSKNAATLAKMHKTLVDGNKNLMDKLAERYGFTADELKSFEIKQAPGAGFYGVYAISTVNKLIESGKTKCSIGKLMIGCKDCADKENPESIVIYDTKKKAIVNSQEGTTKSDARLKKYVAEVTAKL